jgi:glutathione peroxidase
MNRKVFSIVKKSAFTILVLIGMLIIYVLIDNRNCKDMSFRQKIMKTVYPFLVRMGNKKQIAAPENKKSTPVSFYSLSATLMSGEILQFEKLRGKKVIIVNTASNCGYTPQYKELQSLYEKEKNTIEILAFPSNDYKQQEKSDNQSIAAFCQKNYGVSFPLMQKIITIKKKDQHPVYQWLTDPEKNGWNNQVPSWNFSKYVINENGELTHYFDPAVSPKDEVFLKAIGR